MAAHRSDLSKGAFIANTRVLQAPMTGVQRYAHEVLSRFETNIETVAPPTGAGGLRGHLWEQTVLPALVRSGFLWSPANTGPWLVSRQVVTIHDAATLDHPEWFNPKFASWYRFLLPKLAHRVQRVITVSEFSRARLVDHTGIASERVSVIPNGVDARFQPPSAQAIQTMRSDCGLPDDYVLVVGSLEPRKNLQRLFMAWEQVRQVYPELTLAVAGASGSVFKGMGFDAIPKGVTTLGRVDDTCLPALYGGAQVFVFPSIYEGFGLPPLEAMACGTAVVTSNVSSIPEVAGEAALLIDPYDPDAIAFGLLRVLGDATLRTELTRKGLERAEQFTWKRTAELTWQLLQAEAAS